MIKRSNDYNISNCSISKIYDNLIDANDSKSISDFFSLADLTASDTSSLYDTSNDLDEKL